MSNKTISIVIPVFNSEKTLVELCDRLKNIFSTLTYSYEIIFIDDSSIDSSWTLLKTIHHNNNHVKIIRHQKNYGQHNATLCGLNHAKGDYIITLDDDLQHPPEEIPKLINKLTEGYSVAYGVFPIKHHSWIENLFSKILQIIKCLILDLPQGFNTSNYAIYSADVIKYVIKIKTSFIYLPAIVTQVTPINSIANVDVMHHPRKEGRSNYNVRKYISLVANLIINYSTFPLVFIGIMGIVTAIFSFSYGSYIVFRHLTDPTFGIVGWGSMMVILTFLGGAILLSIAIIGEYLRRILTEVSHGQQYVIAEMEL